MKQVSLAATCVIGEQTALLSFCCLLLPLPPPPPPPPPAMDAPDEEQLERESFLKVISAFRSYEADALLDVARWEANHAQLSPRHRALLPAQPAYFAAARHAVAQNACFFDSLLSTFEGPHVPDHLRVPLRSQLRCPPTPPGDAEKVRYVLRNLVRDWSADGAEERARCYGPLLERLRALLPSSPAAPCSVLVPGAGLGRLCCEVVAAGYCAEGCEWCGSSCEVPSRR